MLIHIPGRSVFSQSITMGDKLFIQQPREISHSLKGQEREFNQSVTKGHKSFTQQPRERIQSINNKGR